MATLPFLILFSQLNLSSVLIIFVTILMLGFFATYRYYQQKNATLDAGWIVIDEFLGLFLAWIPFYPNVSWPVMLTLFITFRFFDIKKIYPANRIDRQKKKFWAVIGDDLVSGIYASATTFLVINFVLPHFH